MCIYYIYTNVYSVKAEEFKYWKKTSGSDTVFLLSGSDTVFLLSDFKYLDKGGASASLAKGTSSSESETSLTENTKIKSWI
jgi:hypothetical protein